MLAQMTNDQAVHLLILDNTVEINSKVKLANYLLKSISVQIPSAFYIDPKDNAPHHIIKCVFLGNT